MNALSFGSIDHSSRHWHIRCEPHVRARLKRVFPRMPQHAADCISLAATPENSRELQWFLDRYPMDMSPDIRAELERQSAEHVEMEQNLQELKAGRLELPPFELALPPRDYQRYAAAQLDIRGGLLLADDLGLGKTVSGIGPMAIPGRLPAVVVYPAHMPNHWPQKLKEFAPNLRVHHIRTSKTYDLIKKPRQRIADLWDTLPDVILVSYHKLRGWADVLGEIVEYAVFEEAQQLRNPDSEIYRACRHLASKAKWRLGLTATPIYNYGSEFFHVVDVLIPGCLGTYEEFLREWCIAAPGEKSKLKDAEQFGAYLRREGIMLRRTRAEVGRELPGLSKIPHEIEADAGVLNRITGDAAALARTILKKNEAYRGEKMRASGDLDALVRQATGVAKAPYVAEFVRLLLESGEKVVLFGWHREVYSIWLEKLKEFNPVMYTGSESPKQKQAAMDAFISGDSQLIILSLRSGAGLDGLQHVASTVVFGELDWSPGVHEQCIGRVYRDGQWLPVMAYFLISEEGSDPIVSDVLGVKREQIEGVRNPGENLVERIDIGENQLRALAKMFLAKVGEAVPDDSNVIPMHVPAANSGAQGQLQL
ncbi:helicase SNF2 (plasmid) [Pseudomonas aeruginosa]|uniref:SNF2-related protein n=1 Tax=Pseudomonas aeruginosa TaxID=287 RepID=UPI001A21C751|nr:DEAD/DEAH box helicase [Pseudomonas aeruginosa]MBH8699179.1 DEAD/DEAH box helicase [Pseudomonas aeruginosa]HEK3608660.1 DEAD/DEAH box helicase [Pseudomonas aeruginosa]